MSVFSNAFTKFAAAALFATSLALPMAHASETLTVFAAASLKDALDAQLAAFNAATGNMARASYAGSNALAKQIEQGAPTSLFISADEAWMDYLATKTTRDAKAVLAQATRRVLLSNELVLIAPASSALRIDASALRIDAASVETREQTKRMIAKVLAQSRFAMADPSAVPAGKYAQESLTNLGLWSTIEPRIARADNVRAALAFVARGESPLGAVYRSDALAEPKVRILAALPSSSHPPIRYVAVIVAANDSPAARQLLEFLSNPAAVATWKRYGFSMPSP